jgi:hypothetical protein
MAHLGISVADNFGGPGERPIRTALPDGYPSEFASNAVEFWYHIEPTGTSELGFKVIA